MAIRKKKREETAVFTAEGETGSGTAGRGQKKKNRRLLRLIIVLLVLGLLTSAVLIVLSIRPAYSGGADIDEFHSPDYLQEKTMNILVCGIDNEEERDRYMTDVIMMVNFDREADKASIFQIPRDTYVGQELVPYGKINGLYYWGYSETVPEDESPAVGVKPLVETVYNQFKLNTDNYILITMEGFRKAVDLLGGVEITIDQPIDFVGHFYLEPGTYTLNGETADVFVRYRETYEQADIDRLRIQQLFMKALMQKLFATSTMDLVSVVSNIFPYLETDLTVAEIISLATEAKQLNAEEITVIRAPGESVPRYGLYGVDVFSIHKKELADILNEYMRPYQEDVLEADLGALEIQNTTEEWVDGATTLGDQTENQNGGTA